MPKARGNAPLDREIRGEIGNMLWCLARGERIRPDVRMSSAQRAAVNQPTIDLVELYEKSSDSVLVDLYEDWQQIQNSDRSANHFAYVLVGTAFDIVEDFGFDSLLTGGKPTFAIELRDGELVWNGELREPEPKHRRRNPAIPSENEYLGQTVGTPTLNPGEPKHWYVFYTPFGRTAPKEYQGPFTLESSARTAMAQDLKKYKASKDGYEVKQLTDDEFKAIWGASPARSNPACPACGAHITSGAASCPACGMKVQAGAGAVATPLESPRVLVTRRGRPPGVPVGNPGPDIPSSPSSWRGHRVYASLPGEPDRTGTVIAVEPRAGSGESRLTIKMDDGSTLTIPEKRVVSVQHAHSVARMPSFDELAKAFAYIEGEYRDISTIDGEQWAEGLAFVATHQGTHRYVSPEARAAMQQLMPQLSERQWRWIAARADYLLTSEGEKPAFTNQER